MVILELLPRAFCPELHVHCCFGTSNEDRQTSTQSAGLAKSSPRHLVFPGDLGAGAGTVGLLRMVSTTCVDGRCWAVFTVHGCVLFAEGKCVVVGCFCGAAATVCLRFRRLPQFEAPSCAPLDGFAFDADQTSSLSGPRPGRVPPAVCAGRQRSPSAPVGPSPIGAGAALTMRAYRRS